MSLKGKSILRFYIFILSLALVVAGCGVKTSPVPPKSVAPNAIGDLRYTVEQGVVTLQWSVPKGKAAGSAGLAGFLVYRATTPSDQPICDGCPVLFRQIANISAEPYLLHDAESMVATYRQEIETGLRYLFKVIAYDKNGQRGPDSNRVEIKSDD